MFFRGRMAIAFLAMGLLVGSAFQIWKSQSDTERSAQASNEASLKSISERISSLHARLNESPRYALTEKDLQILERQGLLEHGPPAALLHALKK